MTAGNITPLFCVSNVTGHGLKLLYTFFNVLPPCISNRERENLLQLESEFQIDETFHRAHVGNVVGGLLVAGVVRSGDWMNIGPFHDGSFVPVQVTSVHRHKVPCRVVRAGESATLALSDNISAALHKEIRKGMVLTTCATLPTCLYFQARITVLEPSESTHHHQVCAGFKATVHIGNVRQTAVVVAIMGKSILAPNETGSVMWRFLKFPEYIHAGCRVLFRQDTFKGVGVVQQVFPITDNVDPMSCVDKSHAEQ